MTKSSRKNVPDGYQTQCCLLPKRHRYQPSYHTLLLTDDVSDDEDDDDDDDDDDCLKRLRMERQQETFIIIRNIIPIYNILSPF